MTLRPVTVSRLGMTPALTQNFDLVTSRRQANQKGADRSIPQENNLTEQLAIKKKLFFTKIFCPAQSCLRSIPKHTIRSFKMTQKAQKMIV